MTAQKHTPGEWLVEDYSEDGESKFCVVPETYFGTVAVCTNEANARLIAAAPEMLEALIMVRDADDDCKMDGLPSMPSFARAKIDAAIAKAEGRS